MTPIEWLLHTPPEETLVHEIGHTVTGLALGIDEQGIELMKCGNGEVARSWYSKLDLPRKIELPRVLAGMYCQAQLCPSTLDQDLSRRLIEHQLFTEPSTLEDYGPLWPIMVKYGLQGDWALVTGLLNDKSGGAQRLRVARSGHKKAAVLFESHRFAEAIPRVIHDMAEWLHAPDTNLPFTANLFYPVANVRSSLKAFGQ